MPMCMGPSWTAGQPRSGHLYPFCCPIFHSFILSTDCVTPCPVLCAHLFAQFFLLWPHLLHFVPRAPGLPSPGQCKMLLLLEPFLWFCPWVTACSSLLTEAGSGLSEVVSSAPLLCDASCLAAATSLFIVPTLLCTHQLSLGSSTG